MKTLTLQNAKDVADVRVGYTWRSPPIKASFWRLICFALASGDWSRTHVNPLTSILFRSNLGGLSYSIDFVLAMTKAGMYEIFRFKEDTEILARGYEQVKFWKPVRIGTYFRYSLTLKERVTVFDKVWCKWLLKVAEEGSNETLCTGIWLAGFSSVQRSSLGKVAYG